MIYKKVKEEIMFKIDPIRAARGKGVKVGSNCRLLGVNRNTFGSEPFLIKLGNHVTITMGVKFINHDGGVWIFREEEPNIDVFGEIVIGNNCFIGVNSILLPGTRIQDNSIVAAGSVVRGHYKPNSVIGGVPGKVIKDINDYKEKVFSQMMDFRNKNERDKRELLEWKFKDKLRG